MIDRNLIHFKQDFLLEEVMPMFNRSKFIKRGLNSWVLNVLELI
jgi:hypothetical protein